MSDFATALQRIRRHGEEILHDAREMLLQLVRDTSEAIAAREGSILVPNDDESELRFLVSMNPTLDPSDISVPVGESISGYVFSSRQAMAKVHPDSPGASKVDEVAKVETKYLLAVPIVDDDRVYGVATFVNRAGDQDGTPFSIDDLKTAEAFGEIYATAMKLYRKVEFSTSVAELEMVDHARDLGIGEGESDAAEAEALERKYRLPARIVEKAVSLPEREREMLLRMADLLDEFREISDEEEIDAF